MQQKQQQETKRKTQQKGETKTDRKGKETEKKQIERKRREASGDQRKMKTFFQNDTTNVCAESSRTGFCSSSFVLVAFFAKPLSKLCSKSNNSLGV